jgi:hypothetical protein
VLAVAQSVDLLLEQRLQPLFALEQRQLSGAVAIQVQKIERKEHELIGTAFIHRCLEPAEHWNTVAIQRAKLAVEIG